MPKDTQKGKKIHMSKFNTHDMVQCQFCDWEFDGYHHTEKETLLAIREHIVKIVKMPHAVHREKGQSINYNFY